MYSTPHYKEASITYEIQPIDICRDLPFSLGNAVKYILRAPYKDDPKSDLIKAKDYLSDYLVTLREHPHLVGLGHTISHRGTFALEMYCARLSIMSCLFHYAPDRDMRVISAGSATDAIVTEDYEDLIQPTEDSVNDTIALLEKKIADLEEADEEIEVAVREKCRRRRHANRH